MSDYRNPSGIRKEGRSNKDNDGRPRIKGQEQQEVASLYIYDKAFAEGYNKGYKHGYGDGYEDCYKDQTHNLDNINRHKEQEMKWYGKKSKSWYWL